MRKLDVVKIKRIDAEMLTCELMTINDDLADFYSQINCHTIDIVQRRFKGRLFDIICDDEALLASEPGLPTSLWFERKEKGGMLLEGLFGTLLLCHSDEEGNLTNATPDDLISIQQAYTEAMTSKGEIFNCLEHDL